MSAWLWDRNTGNSHPWNVLPFQLLLFMSLLLTYSVPPKLAQVSPMPIYTHLWSRERFAAAGGADVVLALVDADPSLPQWHSETLHGTHGQLCPKDAGEFNPCCQYPLTFNKIDKVCSQTLVSLRQPSDTVPRMMNLEIHKRQCSPKLNGTEEHSGTNLDPQFVPQQRKGGYSGCTFLSSPSLQHNRLEQGQQHKLAMTGLSNDRFNGRVDIPECYSGGLYVGSGLLCSTEPPMGANEVRSTLKELDPHKRHLWSRPGTTWAQLILDKWKELK